MNASPSIPPVCRGFPAYVARGSPSAVLGQLAAGQSIDEILTDYPQLEREDVLAALEFAAAYTRERVMDLPAAG